MPDRFPAEVLDELAGIVGTHGPVMVLLSCRGHRVGRLIDVDDPQVVRLVIESMAVRMELRSGRPAQEWRWDFERG